MDNQAVNSDGNGHSGNIDGAESIKSAGETISTSANGAVPLQNIDPNESAEQAVAAKKSQKWLIIGIILLVLAVAATAVVWIWKPWESNQGASQDETAAKQPTEDANTPDDTDIQPNVPVQVDVNDETVQAVYERFGVDNGQYSYIGTHNGAYWLDLLWNGGSDDVVLQLAFLNTLETKCKKTGRKSSEFSIQSNALCIDGEAMRQRMREMFGREVSVPDGRFMPIWDVDKYEGGIESYEYDPVVDEFWPTGAGGGGGVTPWPGLAREIFKAERDAEHLYIYEYAAVANFVERELTVKNMEELEKTVSGSPDWLFEAKWFNIRGKVELDSATRRPSHVYYDLAVDEAVPGMDSIGTFALLGSGRVYEIDANGYGICGKRGDNGRCLGSEKLRRAADTVKLADYADGVGQFKWTFKRDAAGNYVFQELGRIK